MLSFSELIFSGQIARFVVYYDSDTAVDDFLHFLCNVVRTSKPFSDSLAGGGILLFIDDVLHLYRFIRLSLIKKISRQNIN
jgi:hypothetical protein